MPDPKLNSELEALDLHGVTITAQIDGQGNLLPVDGSFDKLLSAAQKRSLPRIHTVVIAADSARTIFREGRAAGLNVLSASTIDDAIHLLLVDQQTRWGRILDYSNILRRHRNFVGRQWLREQVNTATEQALANPDTPPYILITGRPGTGKTAFVANQVQSDPAAVYHFIRREGDLDNPESLLRSLTHQLRKIHALAALPVEETSSPTGAFYQVLQRASDEMLSEGSLERQVVWIDGLDEAFGPTGRFSTQRLDTILPLRGLPPRVVFVLTSRHEGPVEWLSDPLICQRIDLDENREANLEDIREYLVLQNQALGLNLSAGFLQRLTEASEGCFVAAVRYLYPGEHLEKNLEEWKRHPERIPPGLDGWLNYQWQVLLAAAQEQGIPQRVVYGVLGYAAMQEGIITQASPESDLFKAMPGVLLLFLRPGDIENCMEPVLRLSAEFFEPVKSGADRSSIPRFFHSRFSEFIRETVIKKSVEPIAATDTIPPPDNAVKSKSEPALGNGIKSEQANKSTRQATLLTWLVFGIAALLLAFGAFYTLNRYWPLAATASFATESYPTSPPASATASASSTPAVPAAAGNPTQETTSSPSPNPTETQFVYQSALVSAESSSVYSYPDENTLPIATLSKGALLEVFGRSAEKKWLAVITDDNLSGWMKTEELALSASVESLLEVLPLATRTPTEVAASQSISPTATPTRPARPRSPNNPTIPPPTSTPPPPTPYP